MPIAGEVITVEEAAKRCAQYEREQMQHMYLFQTRFAYHTFKLKRFGKPSSDLAKCSCSQIVHQGNHAKVYRH